LRRSMAAGRERRAKEPCRPPATAATTHYRRIRTGHGQNHATEIDHVRMAAEPYYFRRHPADGPIHPRTLDHNLAAILNWQFVDCLPVCPGKIPEAVHCTPARARRC